MSEYNPPQNPRLRVIEAMGRTLVILGTPGEATFDITPEEAVSLGMALMETGLKHGGKLTITN